MDVHGPIDSIDVPSPSSTIATRYSSKRIGRREAIGVMGGAGAALTFGCADSPTIPSPTTSTSTSSTGTNAGCTVTPTETAYSEYGTQSAETFLRGIQTTNSDGEVTFTTIYPGWYQGRATHIHFEVKINGVSRKVTQIAFPESVNNAVHVTGVYASRGTNPMSNLSDGVFSDSLSSELVTPTGSTESGYAATVQVGTSI